MRITTHLRSLRATKSYKFLLLLGASMALVCLLSLPARADVIGFNGGVGWTPNSGPFHSDVPAFGPNSVVLTNGAFFDISSVWFDTPQSLASFTASFTYTATFTPGPLLNPADGVTFALQNTSTNYLGTGGGHFGYGSGTGTSLGPSAAVEFNLFNGLGSQVAPGTQFTTNGLTQQDGGPGYLSTNPVALASGDPIAVTLTYDSLASTLLETLIDSTALTSFSHTYTGVNLAGTVGSPTAFVGFTGATGGGTSTQTISNFQFTTAPVPEPSSLLLLGTGLASCAGFMRRKIRKKDALK